MILATVLARALEELVQSESGRWETEGRAPVNGDGLAVEALRIAKAGG